jgi:tetratricopeptide (TPR) repeat protein
MMSRLMLCAVMALAVQFSAGCSPTLRISRLRPSTVNLGAAKQLSVVQMEGRHKARQQILSNFMNHMRYRGHYKVTNRLDDGIVVELSAGGAASLKGGQDTTLAADEVALRIDVAEWNTDSGAETVDEKDKDGKVTGQKKVDFYDGEIALLVTAFNGKGKTFLAEKQYTARARTYSSTDEALRQASDAVISQLVNDLTPYRVVDEVRMDNDDEAQHPMLELAEKGNIHGAVEQLEVYLKDNPSNAPALYNLAVFQDASGNYEKAVELYTQAIALAPKDYYIQMKTECERRMRDQQALAE